MRLLVRLTSSFDFGAGQSTRCGLAVLKVLQGSRSIGAICGQANQNRGEVQGNTFPPEHPLFFISGCVFDFMRCFYQLGALGGAR